MERYLWIPTWRGDRCCRAASREFVAGTGLRHRPSCTGPPASGHNASLSRTARILLDRHPIPKYTFAPLTAGEIVVPRGR